jgi:hypothetical protein
MTFENKQWTAVFVGLALIEASLLYKLVAEQTQASPGELIIAVCAVGILLLLSSKVEGLKAISMGTQGFKAELQVIERKTSDNERAITDLIVLSMGESTYTNLKKLAKGSFGEFRKEPYVGLETELYYLRNLGYVVLKDGRARSIHEIPESGDELSDYVEVTPAGQKYLQLRETYTPKRGQ